MLKKIAELKDDEIPGVMLYIMATSVDERDRQIARDLLKKLDEEADAHPDGKVTDEVDKMISSLAGLIAHGKKDTPEYLYMLDKLFWLLNLIAYARGVMSLQEDFETSIHDLTIVQKELQQSQSQFIM